MSDDRLRGFSSAFDEVLASNRRQLDELLSKTQSAPGTWRPVSGHGTHQAPVATPPVARTARPPGAGAHPGGFDAQASAAVQRLNERFGDAWRYEIVETIREAGELIVRCEVTLTQSGARKAQFGSAPVSSSGARISGAAGGIDFSLELNETAAGHSAGGAERSALQQAVETALTRCERML